MLARLWWKEFRAFYPVWLVLLLAAGLLQVLFVTVYRKDMASPQTLIATALCWAGLYAFASGAAAFAGERESKTLGFLDALPVSRWKLWVGKVSFTLLSTFGLAVVLTGLAAFGIEGRGPTQEYGIRDYWRYVPAVATLLFEAAAWSLLWSSLSKNPLMAGVFGVLSVYGSAALAGLLPQLDERLAGGGDIFGPGSEPARIVVASAALALSCFAMVRKPGAAWSTRERRLPVDSAPVPIHSSSRWRSLAWLAIREGWANWLLLALVGLIGLALTSARDEGPLAAVVATLAGLVAGVGVFGTEDASGPRRFLVHHGLSGGAVWWRKLLPSIVVPAGAFALMSGIGSGSTLPMSLRPTSGPLGRDWVWLLGLVLADSFAVGLLAGMAIRRRITAGLVGVIVLVGLLPLQVTLAVAEVVPPWSVLLAPAILVGVSRGWAGDWLMEREGARPWLRLGAWLVVPSILLFGAFVAYRAFGVADVGPQYVAATLQAPAPPADQDAAILYRQAAQAIAGGSELYGGANQNYSHPIDAVIENGWDNMSARVVAYWAKNREAIDLARRASTLPRGRFEDVARLSYRDESTYRTGRDLRRVQQLLALDVREKLSRGDLPGVWVDILAEFRMANQLANDSPTIAQMNFATFVHHEAVGLAFAWLGATGQSDASIRRALDDLKVLHPLPDLRATIQVESSLIERALGLPGDDLAVILCGGPDVRKISALDLFFYSQVVAAPWERQRARRVCRLRVSEEMPEAALEPYQRPKGAGPAHPGQVEYFLGSKLLAGQLLPYFQSTIDRLDREQVGRRALLQAVAVEIWERSHEGKPPEKLADLVPSLLDRLPLDPFSGREFGYLISDGRSVRPPLAYEGNSSLYQATRPGQPLIYSVAMDSKVIRQQPSGDYVYYAVP